MRNIFIFALLISSVFCSAFQVEAFGPAADDFSCANLDQIPVSFGIRINNQEKLCLWENGVWDNAVVESFFHSLKTEWTSKILYQTRNDARNDVIKYIEMFYNSQRLHSYLGYKQPNDFEKNFSWANVA